MNTEFYPSLFEKVESKKKEEESVVIKNTKREKGTLKTLYDSLLVPVEQMNPSFITIFGSCNTELLKKKISECGEVNEMKFGRNYVNVNFTDEESVKKLLKLDKQIINGEMIGVYRNKMVIEVADVVIKKKGFFSNIVEYLFGA